MSGNTGFQFKYNLVGRTSGIQRSFTINNSATITVGDMVILSSGYIALAPANTPIMGCVVGLTDSDGIDLASSRKVLAGSGASYTASTRTVVAGSDNSTTDLLKAIIDVDPFSVWSAAPDAAIGSTGASILTGSYCDLVATAGDQPDESDASASQQQLFIWGLDPENSSNGLYSIAQHQLWGWTIV